MLGWINSGTSMTLVDVREPWEYAAGHLQGAINLAWTSGVLAQSTAQLATDEPLVVYCRSGSRSNGAATFLAANGFAPVYDMLGGVLAWMMAGYPMVK